MQSKLAPIKPLRFEFGDEVSCPRCEDVLERHQPDSCRPERILGVCSSCSAWFLIDEHWCVLYPLPEVWGGTKEDN